jgi:hypothetical protein
VSKSNAADDRGLCIPLGSRVVAHQLGEGHAQHAGHEPQIQDGDVPFAALHRADEGAVQLALFGQEGLRLAALGPHVANAVAQVLEEVRVVKVHWCLTGIFPIVQAVALQGMSPVALGQDKVRELLPQRTDEKGSTGIVSGDRSLEVDQ